MEAPPIFEDEFPEAAKILARLYLKKRFPRYSQITRSYGMHYLPDDILVFVTR